MLVHRNMKHVYWYVRNLQIMLKGLGAVRNHSWPQYDTLHQGVTGTQLAELAIAKYHFRGTLSTPAILAAYREELARAKFGMVGAKLNEEELEALVARLSDDDFEGYVHSRRIKEGLEALVVISGADIFKRPPWFTFASSVNLSDKYLWSLPPDFE